MTFTGLFSYLSTSSFLFQQLYAFTPQQYGLLFAVNSIGIIIGVQASSRLMRGPVPPQWIIAVTTVVHLAMAIAIIVLDSSGAGLWGTAIPLWIYIAACGFTFPAVQVLALAPHGAEAGTAASLLGALNFGLAGLHLAAHRHDGRRQRHADGVHDGARGGRRDRSALDPRASEERAGAQRLAASFERMPRRRGVGFAGKAPPRGIRSPALANGRLAWTHERIGPSPRAPRGRSRP